MLPTLVCIRLFLNLRYNIYQIEADTTQAKSLERYGHLTSPHFSPFNYLYWGMFTVLFA